MPAHENLWSFEDSFSKAVSCDPQHTKDLLDKRENEVAATLKRCVSGVGGHGSGIVFCGFEDGIQTVEYKPCVVEAPVLLKKWQAKDARGLIEYCMLQQLHPVEPHSGLENPFVDLKKAKLEFLSEAASQQHLKFMANFTPKLYGVYRKIPGTFTYRRLEEWEFLEAVKESTLGLSCELNPLWIGMTNANFVSVPPGYEICMSGDKHYRATLDFKLGTNTCDPNEPNAKKRMKHEAVDRLTTSRDHGVCVISGKWHDVDGSLESFRSDDLLTNVVEWSKNQAKFVGRNISKPGEWGERGLKKILKSFLVSEDLRVDFLNQVFQLREWSRLSEHKQPPFTMIGSSILLNYTLLSSGRQLKAHLSFCLIDFAHVLPTVGNEAVLAGYRTGLDTLARLGQKVWKSCPADLEAKARTSVGNMFADDLPQLPYTIKPRGMGPTLLGHVSAVVASESKNLQREAELEQQKADSDFQGLVNQFPHSREAAHAVLKQDSPDDIRTIICRAILHVGVPLMSQTSQSRDLHLGYTSL